MNTTGDLTGISKIRPLVTRSISAENFDGSAGGGARAITGAGANSARELGVGWKISPCVDIENNSVFELANIDGAGRITHIWMTTDSRNWRDLVLRAYWDGSVEPAIEVPYGDFFCNGWGKYTPVSSQVIASNPNGGFNSYWPMPFGESARITLENVSDRSCNVYYQITYEVGERQSDDAYFHAQWRRSNPLDDMTPHTVLDGVEGHGQYVGTYLAWGVNSNGWWGEGEVKFYMDDDQEFPTICGTGTEDYFGGAWNFEIPGQGYSEFCTPYLGMPQVIRPDGLYRSQQRFGLYRWHLPDPIYFQKSLSVNIQALGWAEPGRLRALRDDIASTAFFYLDRSSCRRPESPTDTSMHIDYAPE